jgi:hypothetical protein
MYPWVDVVLIGLDVGALVLLGNRVDWYRLNWPIVILGLVEMARFLA